MNDAERLRAALRCARPDDDPPADWTAQLLQRVPPPGRALPPAREAALWLAAWLLLLGLAGLVGLVALKGAGLSETWHPVLPWALCAILALIPRSRRRPH